MIKNTSKRAWARHNRTHFYVYVVWEYVNSRLTERVPSAAKTKPHAYHRAEQRVWEVLCCGTATTIMAILIYSIFLRNVIEYVYTRNVRSGLDSIHVACFADTERIINLQCCILYFIFNLVVFVAWLSRVCRVYGLVWWENMRPHHLMDNVNKHNLHKLPEVCKYKYKWEYSNHMFF